MNPALLALIAAAIQSVTQIVEDLSKGVITEDEAATLLQNSAVAYSQARAAWDAAKAAAAKP